MGGNLSNLPSGNAPSEFTTREGSAARLSFAVVVADVSSDVVSDCCEMGAAIGCGCGGKAAVFGWTAGCGVFSTAFTGVGNGFGGSWTTDVLGGDGNGLGSVMAVIFVGFGDVAGFV